MANDVVQQVAASYSSTQQQREIWMAAQMSDDANCAFNESITVDLRGPLDTAAFMEAIENVIRQRDTLRCTLSEDGRQICRLPVEYLLLQGQHTDLSCSRADCSLDQLVYMHSRMPFSLDGPLLRFHLITHHANHHTLLLVCHSLIGGAHTLKLLSDDILASYQAKDLPSAHPHVDYALWEETGFAQDVAAANLCYWSDKLKTSAPFLELPLDKPRPAQKNYRAEHCVRILSDEAARQLQQVAAERGWKPTVVLMAAYSAFMHRLTGNRDILFGLPVPVDLPEQSPVLGSGSRLLPLSVTVDANASFAALVEQVQSEAEQACDKRFVTFSKLLNALNFQRDPSRPILLSTAFDVIDSLTSTHGNLDVECRFQPNQFEHLDMRWTVELSTSARLTCVYNPDLWRKETVDMRLQEFETLLSCAVDDPDTLIDDLQILPGAEVWRLLQVASGPVRKAPAKDLVSLLSLPRFADRTAVICGSESLTYAELEHQSNQLARHLISLGVKRNDLVGVFVERSVGMLVSLLGVWKAGAAYVALDPNYPMERLLYMAEAAQLTALITESNVAEGLSEYQCPRVYLDQDAAQIAGYESSALPNDGSGADDTAYVIFTSGSTGKPKGVQITHGGVINFLVAMSQRPGLEAEDHFLAVTTLSFDIAIMELCLPLLVGGRVIIARREEALDGYRLLELIDEHKINVMQATPTTWRWMLAAGWQGQENFKILCGGEPFPLDLARQLLPLVAEVWNLYGPTEATVWSTCHRISQVEDLNGGSIPVGTPVDNTLCYILDDKMRPVPHGVPGELYIGGDGVANGYIGQPEKTAEVFLANIIDHRGRLYRTGDQARWRLDGNFECLGRLDGQIKLRGYRIELGEIEAALASYPAVVECAVSVISYSQADQRLVAYVKLAGDSVLNNSELRQHLRKFLPDYMVPQLFMEVASLPLTPNGKIDRKNLPRPDLAQINDAHCATALPSNETERKLVDIWSQLLKKDCESVDQLFFDVGGHSLLAMDMIAIIQQEFGVRLHVLDILVSTVEQLAAKIQTSLVSRTTQTSSFALEL